MVQLRDKTLDAKPLLARARIVADICAGAGVPFIFNDRPDLALEVGADGVHVGQDDAPVSLARRILGPDAILGLSTHSAEDLEEAAGEDASYISAGPVEATPTKPGRPGTGLDYLRLATERSKSAGLRHRWRDTRGRFPNWLEPELDHFVVVRYPHRGGRSSAGCPDPAGRTNCFSGSIGALRGSSPAASPAGREEAPRVAAEHAILGGGQLVGIDLVAHLTGVCLEVER